MNIYWNLLSGDKLSEMAVNFHVSAIELVLLELQFASQRFQKD